MNLKGLPLKFPNPTKVQIEYAKFIELDAVGRRYGKLPAEVLTTMSHRYFAYATSLIRAEGEYNAYLARKNKQKR